MSLVRVGLIYHGHCEPDLAERVLALAKLLDSDEFAVREKAQKELESMGRAAYVRRDTDTRYSFGRRDDGGAQGLLAQGARSR